MSNIPIIDLIYPRRCPVCQGIVENTDRQALICIGCKEKLPYVQTPACMKCGKEIENPEQEYCSDCVRMPKRFTHGYPVFNYVEPLKEGVGAFKYQNRREYADFYVDEIWKVHGKDLLKLNLDGIIPVPIHGRKRRRRGYNQTELLARGLSRKLQVPNYEKLLIRQINTLPQKALNDKERLDNLKRAFFFRENDVKLKKVLLVDDIYTSGATIEACTDALLQGGVQRVYYTSICIGKGFN